MYSLLLKASLLFAMMVAILGQALPQHYGSGDGDYADDSNAN